MICEVSNYYKTFPKCSALFYPDCIITETLMLITENPNAQLAYVS